MFTTTFHNSLFYPQHSNKNLVFGADGFGHGNSWSIGYRVFSRFDHRVNFVDDGFAVNVGWTRLAWALGFGPSSSFVIDMLRKANAEKKERGITRQRKYQKVTWTLQHPSEFKCSTHVLLSRTPNNWGAKADADTNKVKKRINDFMILNSTTRTCVLRKVVLVVTCGQRLTVNQVSPAVNGQGRLSILGPAMENRCDG